MDRLKRVFEIKAVEEDGSFKGYASVFDNLDSYWDVVVKGAFVDTLKESNGAVPILWNHNDSEPIGWGMKAMEDARGLYVEGRISTDIQRGREILSVARMAQEAGRPIGLSIGYVAKKYSYGSREERVLEAVDLKEYSFTLFPANEKATVTAVKTLIEGGDAKEIAAKKRDLERILTDAGCSAKQAKAAVASIFGRDAEDEAEQVGAIKNELEKLIQSLKA